MVQRNRPALHTLDQALLPLVEQKDDVLDVLGRDRFVDDGVGVVAAFAQDFDVGQDFQRVGDRAGRCSPPGS